MIRTAMCVVALSALAGCFRPEIRETVLELPGVTRAEEIRALRDYLLKEQSILSVNANRNPTRLVVRHHAADAARRNIEDRLHRHGYQVNDLPGDPARRAEFRGRVLFK